MWDCVVCKKSYPKGSKFYQIDVIEDDILVSSYHDQALLRLLPNVKPNDPICGNCVNLHAIHKYSFDREPNYLFEQEGYVCVSSESDRYTRPLGQCCKCDEEIVLSGWTKMLNELNRQNTAFFIWNSNLASRCFPDPLLPQAYQLKELFHSATYPSIMCFDCFNVIKTTPIEGPIICHLCNKKYQRWIFHWAKKPIEKGADCYCFEDDGVIYDSDVDPYTYQWITSLRPENYDSTKPFCSNCLSCLISNAYIEPDFADDNNI